MTKVNVIDTKGKKLSPMTISDGLLNVKVNDDLLAQAVRVYLSNQRQPGSRTKSRSEINATKAKAWRQKGTGRARHGAKSAPIFVGGGKAHGPTGLENYKKKLTKKMRQQALIQALSLQFENKAIVVVNDLSKLDAKTKTAKDVLASTCDYPKTKKVLVILENSKQPLIPATKNLEKVSTTQASRLNIYEIINNDVLLITKTALKNMEEILIKEKKAVDADKKKKVIAKKEGVKEK